VRGIPGLAHFLQANLPIPRAKLKFFVIPQGVFPLDRPWDIKNTLGSNIQTSRHILTFSFKYRFKKKVAFIKIKTHKKI
jgi:hypothetical protein